jgi:hypothetical protein
MELRGVQFEEETFKGHSVNNYQNEPESKMIKLLIKSGVVKTRKQANVFLLLCVVVFSLTSVYVFSKTIEPDVPIIPYKDLTPEQKNQVPMEEQIYIERTLQTTGK